MPAKPRVRQLAILVAAVLLLATAPGPEPSCGRG